MRVRPRELPQGSLPRVSVVVPLYNYGRYLSECVESLVSQRGVDIDITIIDDASSDNSREVAERLAQRHDQIRVRTHPKNLGHIATFNEALASAEAPYVLKMDADDVMPPGSLRRSVELMQAFPDTAFVYGHVVEFTDDPPDSVRTAVRSWSVWDGEDWMWRVVRRGRNVIRQPEVLIRRSSLDQVGGHRPEVPAASDLNLWLRLTTVGSVGRVNGPVQGFYRVHGESMQHTIHAGYLADFKARVAAFHLFTDECGGCIDDPQALKDAINRALARDALGIVKRASDGRKSLSEPALELLSLAASLDPAVTESRGWASVAPGRVVRSGPRATAVHAAGAAWRDLEDRLRWRHWRRYGL